MGRITRRSLLTSGLLFGSVACSRRDAVASGVAEASFPLPIPPLLDARDQGQTLALRVQAGTTSFYPARPSNTLGLQRELPWAHPEGPSRR